MKRADRFASLFVLLLLTAGAARAQQAGFYLKDGDRVVFYGDSITDQRLYTTFVETFVVTRFPRMNVSFVHSGWGGDRVTGGGGGKIDERLRRDVIAYKPTVVTIMLGMNDASYKAHDAEVFNTYADGYRHITGTLKSAAPGARLTLIRPSPYDDVTRAPTFDGGYNAVLLRYGDFVQELARKEGHHVADLNAPVVAALQKANTIDAALAQRIVPDRVHPGAGGHLLMAEALLRAWNAPALVSAVEIDAAASKVVRADNTKATGLGKGGLSWTQEDAALPLPLDMKDTALALAVRASDVINNLNRQTLRVTNLGAPRYTLKIDDEEVGSFTKEQLGEGINLATLQTPMTKQAAAVHALTLKHNNVHFASWRQVSVPNQDLDAALIKDATKALDALEAELVRRQRAAAQPKARRYELIPQT